MGRRGPPAKPTALKRKAGNPGEKPLNDREWQPGGEPERPPLIGDDPRMLAVWQSLVPLLSAGGLATIADGKILGRYCAMYVQWVDAADHVRQHGSVFEERSAPTTAHPDGVVLKMRETPQSKQVRDLHRSLLLVEREFGLTPAARSRIIVSVNAKTGGGKLDQLKQTHFGLRIASA